MEGGDDDSRFGFLRTIKIQMYTKTSGHDYHYGWSTIIGVIIPFLRLSLYRHLTKVSTTIETSPVRIEGLKVSVSHLNHLRENFLMSIDFPLTVAIRPITISIVVTKKIYSTRKIIGLPEVLSTKLRMKI